MPGLGLSNALSLGIGSRLGGVVGEVSDDVLNQVANIGADTRSGAGGYQIVTRLGNAAADVTDAGTGTATGYTLSSGVVTPSSDGGLSGQNGNTIILDDGAVVTLAVAEDTLTVLDDTEMAAAVVWANGEANAKTVAARNGFYDLPSTNWNRDMTGKLLTVTHADTRRGPTFLNAGDTLNGAKFLRFDGMRFYRSEDYITGTGNPAFFTHSATTSDITYFDCLFEGDTISDAVLNDTESTYVGGYPCPKTISADASGSVVVDQCEFRFIDSATLPLVDGTVIRDNVVDGYYLDPIRLAANDLTDGGEVLVSGNVFGTAFGRYNEAGASTPHPDGGLQVFTRGGSSPVSGVTLIIEDHIAFAGNARADNVQGIFTQGSGIRRLIVNNTALCMKGSIHGVSVDGQTDDDIDIIVARSALFNAEDTGGLQLRYADFNGHILAFESAFSGALTDNGTSPDLTTENVGSVFNADGADLTGPLTPDTAADLLAAYTPVAASDLDGLGPVSAGALRDKIGVPRPAAAPTLTDLGESLTIEFTAPSDLDGATVDRYQARYRVSGDGNAWTTVDDIAASEDVSSLSAATYEVQTRPITTDGLPGFWSESASETVTAVVSNLATGPTVVSNAILLDEGGGVYTMEADSTGTCRVAYEIDTSTHGTALNAEGFVQEIVRGGAAKVTIVRDSATDDGTGDNLYNETGAGFSEDPFDVDFDANGAATSYLQVIVASATAGDKIRFRVTVTSTA